MCAGGSTGLGALSYRSKQMSSVNTKGKFYCLDREERWKEEVSALARQGSSCFPGYRICGMKISVLDMG